MDLARVWEDQSALASDAVAHARAELMPAQYCDVGSHGFDLKAYWLEVEQLPDSVRSRGSINRGELFELAAALKRPGDSEELGGESFPWTRFLTACYAWGYARFNWGPGRLARVLDPANNSPRAVEDALAHAVHLLDSEGALSAYYCLRNSGRDDGGFRLTFLGPAFFTKFLYFAAAPGTAPQPLILDQVLAEAVRALCGRRQLLQGHRWRTSEYAFYLAFMHQLSAHAPHGCAPDALERALFKARPKL